ncbi:hypothetical protein [Fischerella thermalis]|uniref:hypothetical protein n=1 Tax=Fischerella thermalis TaxID=372787 RepID=UPI00307E4982
MLCIHPTPKGQESLLRNCPLWAFCFKNCKWQILETDSECVFAHCCDWEGKAAIAVHNLSDKPCIARLQVQEYKYLFDLFSDSEYEPLNGDGDLSSIALEAYGYRWLQVKRSPQTNGRAKAIAT